jgi:hypothetical protein
LIVAKWNLDCDDIMVGDDEKPMIQVASKAACRETADGG